MGPREAHVNSQPAAVEWAINLLATVGVWPVITVGSVAVLAAWCGLGTLLWRRDQHREQAAAERAIDELQQYANDPHTRTRLDQTCQPRKEKP
jgi:nitrate reductase NapE component